MPISSELSDAAIMAATQFETNTATGRFRFKIKLPSGRDIHSEWIAESSKTQGMLKWCEAVNLEIKADKEEDLARQKRKALEERTSAPIVTPESTTIIPSIPPALSGTSSATGVGPSSMSDPIAFAKQVLSELEQTERELAGNLAAIASSLNKVRQDLAAWRQIVSSFASSPSPCAETPTLPGPTD